MEWIKKHVDTVLILGGILGAVLWMNGQFNEIHEDLTVIKTVLIMKRIMPTDLAIQGDAP